MLLFMRLRYFAVKTSGRFAAAANEEPLTGRGAWPRFSIVAPDDAPRVATEISESSFSYQLCAHNEGPCWPCL